MNHTIAEPLLFQLSQHLAAQLGLYFPRARWRDLEWGIGAAAREFGFQDPVACIRWLLSSALTKSQTQILACHLSVGETYFFRERRSLEILEAQILPELIRARRGTAQRLRIWSAGCCTGEEPYSIAILLSKRMPYQNQKG